MNLDRHIWEGWTPRLFIEELEPMFNMIMRGQSWKKPFVTKEDIKDWCKNEQPYYKKHIPEVANYFIKKAGL